jgi:S1 RNA binding domain
MSRREDLSLDKHANPDSLQSAETGRHAIGTGGNEGVGGYEQLLDQYGGSGTPSEGEVVRGKVLKITATDVLVDVGFKSEGVIPLTEFLRPDGSVEVQPGDEVDVLIEFAEDLQGRIVLSREKAERISSSAIENGVRGRWSGLSPWPATSAHI